MRNIFALPFCTIFRMCPHRENRTLVHYAWAQKFSEKSD